MGGFRGNGVRLRSGSVGAPGVPPGSAPSYWMPAPECIISVGHRMTPSLAAVAIQGFVRAPPDEAADRWGDRGVPR
jgi:hypothetical protein